MATCLYQYNNLITDLSVITVYFYYVFCCCGDFVCLFIILASCPSPKKYSLLAPETSVSPPQPPTACILQIRLVSFAFRVLYDTYFICVCSFAFYNSFMNLLPFSQTLCSPKECWPPLLLLDLCTDSSVWNMFTLLKNHWSCEASGQCHLHESVCNFSQNAYDYDSSLPNLLCHCFLLQVLATSWLDSA